MVSWNGKLYIGTAGGLGGKVYGRGHVPPLGGQIFEVAQDLSVCREAWLHPHTPGWPQELQRDLSKRPKEAQRELLKKSKAKLDNLNAVLRRADLGSARDKAAGHPSAARKELDTVSQLVRRALRSSNPQERAELAKQAWLHVQAAGAELDQLRDAAGPAPGRAVPRTGPAPGRSTHGR